MKIQLMKIWMLIFSVLIIFSIIGGWFYWSQWRPSNIRHDCSWIKHHSDPDPGVSIEEAAKKTRDCLAKLNDNPFKDVCNFNSRDPQPAKDWYEPSTNQEYQFCLRNHGI